MAIDALILDGSSENRATGQKLRYKTTFSLMALFNTYALHCSPYTVGCSLRKEICADLYD